MRRLGIAAGILVAAVAAAFALAWFVPSIQDAIVSRAIVGQVAKADAAAAFKDDALHILLPARRRSMPNSNSFPANAPRRDAR